MFDALKKAIREFVLKTFLAGVVADIVATGLTEEDRTFLLAELEG